MSHKQLDQPLIKENCEDISVKILKLNMLSNFPKQLLLDHSQLGLGDGAPLEQGPGGQEEQAWEVVVVVREDIENISETLTVENSPHSQVPFNMATMVSIHRLILLVQ